MKKKSNIKENLKQVLLILSIDIKDWFKGFTKRTKGFLGINLPNEKSIPAEPVKKCRLTFWGSIVFILVTISLLIMSLINKNDYIDLIVPVLIICIISSVYSLYAGGKMYERYINDGYFSLKGIITSVSRSIMGEVIEATLIDDEGMFFDFKVESGIRIKKRVRYEVCYYDMDGTKFIASAKSLGKIHKKQLKDYMEHYEREEERKDEQPQEK